MLRLILKHIPALVGVLFLWAGIYKLLFPGAATLGLYSLDIPFNVANWLITLVIIAELYLGTLLLLKVDLKYALSASIGLMFLFTTYVWYLSTLANPPSCGCLGLTGVFTSNRHAALFGLFQNCVILWMLKLSYDYHVPKQGPVSLKQPSNA